MDENATAPTAPAPAAGQPAGNEPPKSMSATIAVSSAVGTPPEAGPESSDLPATPEPLEPTAPDVSTLDEAEQFVAEAMQKVEAAFAGIPNHVSAGIGDVKNAIEALVRHLVGTKPPPGS